VGSLLLDSSLVASGSFTSQCSWNTPSLIRIISTTTMAEPSGLEAAMNHHIVAFSHHDAVLPLGSSGPGSH
jgi:hypothetical protein